MEITSPDQLTGPVIREMRERMGMTLEAFWGPLGVGRSRGSTYETGVHRIDPPARLLVYLHHVCGFPVALPHDSMRVIGASANYIGEARMNMDAAAKLTQSAVNQLNNATHILGEI